MTLHNDVFKQQIWDFFCDDLESCLAVSQIKQKNPNNTSFKGGLNFTAALAIFSVIEFATGFYSGKDPKTDTVADFICEYFGRHWPSARDKEFARKFYVVFRHGLSHQWSPKAGGISMNFQHNLVLQFVKTEDGSEEIPFLNIPPLFKITKDALRDFETDLDNNTKLRENFSKRYKKLVQKDYTEMRILREIFSKTNKS